MGGDPKDDQDKRRSPLAVWLIAGAVCLPFAYVLSVGPAVRLHDAGYFGDAILWLYAPLIWLHMYSPAARQVMDWYIGLWGG